jgi:hypothetical protein
LRGLLAAALLTAGGTGCQRTYVPGDPVGPDGQAAARASCEKTLAALDAGSAAQVWDGLAARSQARVKEDYSEESSEGGGKNADEKTRAVKILRGIVGKKAKVKEVRGIVDGVMVLVEKADGKSFELEMVPEGGAWKLHMYAG